MAGEQKLGYISGEEFDLAIPLKVPVREFLGALGRL